MRYEIGALIVALTLAGCASSATPAPSPSTVTRTATPKPVPTSIEAPQPWPAPDDQLTPGAVVKCTLPRDPSERDVTLATKKAVAAAYRYEGPWDLADVEFDHRIPFSLCGANDARNIWPEPADGIRQAGFVHNRKDRLEKVIADRVRSKKMTLAEGQQVFRGDWRLAYCHYVLAEPVCAS